MGILLDSLRSVDFLAGASEEDVTRFMVSGKSVEYSRGHVFWRAGRVPEGLVIPVTGEAKTTTRSPEGREFIDRFLGPGDCFGLASALDGMEDPTDAEVVRGGEFFTIPRAHFHRFLHERPETRRRATAMVGALYRRSLKEREDVALRPVPRRLADFLLRNACARQTDGARVLVNATQAELAARLGTVREVVARIFADLEDRGLLRRDEGALFIMDWAGLHAEAGFEPGAGLGKEAAEAAAVRTSRFFLPTIERMRRHGGADEAARCLEVLGDLRLCRERGCAGALDLAKRQASR